MVLFEDTIKRIKSFLTDGQAPADEISSGSEEAENVPAVLQYAVCALAFLIPLLQIARLPLSMLTGLPVQSFVYMPIAVLAVIGFCLELKSKSIAGNIKCNWLFFLWAGYAAVSTIWSPDKFRGVMFIGTLLCGFGCIGIFKKRVLSEKVFQGFVTGVTVMSLFMMLLYVDMGAQLITNKRFANIYLPIFDVYVSYVNANAWAFYTLFAVVIILFLSAKRRADLYTYMTLNFYTWTLWLTKSRGTILTLLGVFISAVVLFNKRKAVFIGALIFFVTLLTTMLFRLLFSVTPNVPDLPFDNKLSAAGFSEEAIVSRRVFIWEPAVEKLINSPGELIFGTGNGGSQVFNWEAMMEYSENMDLKRLQSGAVNMHNTYIEFIVDYGIIGFLLFCVFFINSAIKLWKTNRNILLFAIPSVVGGMANSYHTLPPFILALSILFAALASVPGNAKISILQRND